MHYKYIKKGELSQRWMVRMMKYTWFIAIAFIVMAVSAEQIKNVFASDKTVYQKQEVEVLVKEDLPILERIADCESGTRLNGKAVKGSASHYDKNGQVLINKTLDVGYMQINVAVWGKTATEMGLNLYNESDNKAFGRWLFREKGSSPWFSSEGCWR
jgi:hypothetical protein